MIPLVVLLLIPADIDIVESKDFPKEAQIRAVTSTVRIVSVTQGEGSGVLLKKSGPFVYILTANHVVDGAKKLEVATFTAESYPNVAAVYRTAEIVAQSASADLAVLRLATKDQMPGSVAICPPSKVPDAKGFAGLTVGCGGGRAPACVVDQVKGKRSVRKPGADSAVLCWEFGGTAVKGRSGGPLLDRRGQLIGVASGVGDGKAYYTHVEEVHTFLRRNALEWLYEDKADK